MAFTPTLFVTILASRNPETGLIEPPYTPAQVLHVKKTGNDTTGTGTFANPYLTINKAQSMLQPSGEIHVYAGRYFESTVANPYVPAQVLMSPVYAATAPRVSGTLAHPCVLRAAAGEEGSVIIDGGGTLAGLVSEAKDNWYLYGLRFENCMNAGIASQGQAVLVPVISSLSENWTVENCCVTGVDSESTGGNVSGIAPWGTRNWTIRNCKIYDIRRNAGMGANRVACIQTYGAINLVLENFDGYGADYGFFAKDHFLYPDLVTTYQGATIRNCRFKTGSVPMYFSIRGTDTAQMGDTLIENTIMHHLGTDSGNSVIYCEMGGALGQSTKLDVKNCVLHAPSSTTVGVFASGVADVRYTDSIMVNGSVQIQMLNQGRPTLLTQCNRNAYTAFNFARMNTFGAGEIYYDWTAWKAATIGNPSSLGLSNPDSLSIISSSAAMFMDISADDYRFKAGSPAIGLGTGGTNAGCYQTNSEYIGLLPTYSAGA